MKWHAKAASDEIKALREALKTRNAQAYFSHAATIENAYLQLSPETRNTYESWAGQYLTK